MNILLAPLERERGYPFTSPDEIPDYVAVANGVRETVVRLLVGFGVYSVMIN